MNDTTRRFLSAIVERIPAGGRIVELRLFPAIRQGGNESGVAVVAVEPPEAPAISDMSGGDSDAASGEGAPATEHSGGEGAADFAVVAHDIVDIDVITEDEEGLTGDEAAAATSPVSLADAAEEDGVGEALDDEMNDIVVSVASLESAATDAATDAALEPDSEAMTDAEAEAATDAEAQAATDAEAQAVTDAEAQAVTDAEAQAVTDAEAEAATELEETAEPARPRRYAVLTARYRYTFKGPDRGKWDMELTHEADAPLDTVERVARGVAKRAGDESEPEHFSGESLRQALEAPAWVTTP
ncbi:MAG: hypothetical protein AMXMBFR55_21110 [Gemmatimonadota bacterium]